jgi:RimJ/RimL family protein N-acetyltransferase
MLLTIPTCLETERLILRAYQAGDGPWFYAMSQRNRDHLARFEAENVVLEATSEEEAEIIVRDLNAAWVARRSFFLAALERATGAFVAQIYVGPSNWDLPEFEIGYFADKDHEGHGYVTEGVHAALWLVFEHMKAHRVRLECDDTNVRSYRVAERCGLVLEGYIRSNKRAPDGGFTGTLHYGLLRSEYAAGSVPVASF